MALFAVSTPAKRTSGSRRISPLFVAVLSLSSAFATFAPAAMAQDATVVEIGSAMLDHNLVNGRRWTRMTFEPLRTGTHTIRVSSRGDADIRFSVFRIANGSKSYDKVRIGTTSGTANPGQWTGKLDVSEKYFLGVWSAANSGKFTATLETAPRFEARAAVTDPIPVKAAKSWQVKGTANVVATAGRTLFVGGDFTEIHNDKGGKLPRRYLAAIDRYTGEPTSFSPKLDGEVWALALSPDNRTLYVGGSFLRAEGLPRKRIAAYDVKSGALTNFVTPAPNSALRAIAVDGDKIYLGGLFTRVGTTSRKYVAAFDRATGELDRKFDASPNDVVKALVAGIDRLWIGGDFTRLNGTRQRGVGALDPDNGSRQATNDVGYPVIDLAVSDSQLFIAGGGPGGRAAAFSRATGVKQWEISSDGNFQAVDVDGGRFVYFGGHYETIEGNERIDRLTRHDKKSGKTDVSWLPRVNGIRSINAIDVTSDGLYIGGDFTKIGEEDHEGFAILPGLTN